MLVTMSVAIAGCALQPAAPPAPPAEPCSDADGPSADTVRRAIAAVPAVAADSTWTESARGYTRNCRLHWVKLTLSDATAASPEQLLFFDHDTPLGSPTPNPKPYTTVLSSGADAVTVQYQWRIGDEPSCCPAGIATTRYRIADGRLKALDPIPDPIPNTELGLRYLGQAQVAPNATFDGTTIGGLSAISYDAGRDCYYVISDDRSTKTPARFYTVRLSLSDSGVDDVSVVATRPLLDDDGRPFGPRSLDGPVPVAPPDPEGIAFDSGRQRLYWSSEGERLTDTPAGPVLADPWIRIAGLDGGYLGRFSMPPGLAMSAQRTGPRRNTTLEGLTLAPGGRLLFAGMEGPGYDDGDLPDREHGALTRITAFEVGSTAPVAQYAYRLEPAAAPAETNGLTDLVALSDTTFLVVERAFSKPSTVRVFRAETAGATDVLAAPSLTAAVATPMTKTLLADLSTTPGLSPLDNIEGITLGPRLPDGRRALVLVSDDNFAPGEVTQFLVFAMN